MFRCPRHRLVQRVLDSLDADFLDAARCYFGGGTRIVMALEEYRESADIDFLCSERAGYRELRSEVSAHSLGRIAKEKMALAREIFADRYGIRTVFDIDGERIKFEIILEGRIELSGTRDARLRVPALDAESCFAEKFLANADRWNDEAFLGRDVVDLAFMASRWDGEAAQAGRERAIAAYGRAVNTSLRRAIAKMSESRDYRRRCLAGLSISDVRRLGAGLRALATLSKRTS